MIDTIRDERAVSVAVTHVLTVGITAILISGLLLGASSMLETQQERSTETALETIGERLASEITSVNQTMNATDDRVAINTSHQRRVGGTQYTVTVDNGSCSTYPLIESNPCLILESNGEDVTVAVPLAEGIDVNNSSVAGGTITIENQGSGITLRESE